MPRRLLHSSSLATWGVPAAVYEYRLQHQVLFGTKEKKIVRVQWKGGEKMAT